MKRYWYECKICGYAIDWFEMENYNGGKPRYVCKECWRPIHNKRISNYYKSENGKKYRRNYHKTEVYKNYIRNYRKIHPQKINREYARKRAKDYRSIFENRIKINARAKVRYALKIGKLKKMPCEICKKKNKVNAHHHDYSKPLNIQWLCTVHHSTFHRKQSA